MYHHVFSSKISCSLKQGDDDDEEDKAEEKCVQAIIIEKNV